MKRIGRVPKHCKQQPAVTSPLIARVSANAAMEREICQHPNTQQHVLALRALADVCNFCWALSIPYGTADIKTIIEKPRNLLEGDLCDNTAFQHYWNHHGLLREVWNPVLTQTEAELPFCKAEHCIMFALQTCRHLPSPWDHQKPHTSCAPALQKPVKGPRTVQFRAVLSKLIHLLCKS